MPRKKKSEYQRIRETLVKNDERLNEMVRIDPDLPAISRADLFMMQFFWELAQEEFRGSETR